LKAVEHIASGKDNELSEEAQRTAERCRSGMIRGEKAKGILATTFLVDDDDDDEELVDSEDGSEL
jgi:hypothetical protein